MNVRTLRLLTGIALILGSWLHLPLRAQTSSPLLIARDLLEGAKRDISALTSPEFEGRGYTGNGHLKAAEYLQERFKTIGLNPLGGSFFQPFPVEVDTFIYTPRLSINDKSLRFGEDFIINPGNGGGSWDDLDIVRVGNGLVIREKGRNDFADLPRGKTIHGSVVVIDGRTPPELEKDTTIDRSQLSEDARIGNAIKGGARGVILLVDRPTYGHFSEEWPLPVFEVRREGFPANAFHISFSVQPSASVEIMTNNVIGYLSGTGGADSTLIICAHYDHLGGVGGGIYFPGANDNASGTALMLALARTFREHPVRFNLLFVAFSGEEIGLYGSRFFADHPPLPLGNIRFLVNLDMAASGLEGVMALGGVDFPEEFALLQNIHDSLGLPELRKRANAPNSDHWFLLRQGIRGFYIYPFTGGQPYHHVDDKPETLQWETFERMYGLVEIFVRRISG